MGLTRRQGLGLALTAAGAGLAPLVLRAQPRNPVNEPFSLGVASGYPSASSVVLWTRLAPQPLEPGGGMPPEPLRVAWQVAADERFARLVAVGETVASPELAHSVHVEVSGLEPARPYWYRFAAGLAVSPVGRTRTAPPDSVLPAAVRLGIANCQHYESGHYAAFAAMADDDLDLIVHVGDYIYETAGVAGVRAHDAAEAETLDDYRQRFALYKSDPLLQRAHATAPWVLTWDDHEVDNNYAGAIGEDGVSAGAFLTRRAAAYQAYYEHLPLPPRMRPLPRSADIYALQRYGALVALYLLDGRQYRSRHACGLGLVAPCEELAAADRSMLGTAQEAWLTDSLRTEGAVWNLLAQQTVFAGMDQRAGPEVGYWADGWSGYPAARERLVDVLSEPRVANPVILSGDLHAFLVNDVHARPGVLDSPIAATEIVTSSISSNGPAQALLDGWQSENANVRFARGERGYTRLTVRPERLDIELIAVDDVARADSATHGIGSWQVEAGRAGVAR